MVKHLDAINIIGTKYHQHLTIQTLLNELTNVKIFLTLFWTLFIFFIASFYLISST